MLRIGLVMNHSGSKYHILLILHQLHGVAMQSNHLIWCQVISVVRKAASGSCNIPCRYEGAAGVNGQKCWKDRMGWNGASIFQFETNGRDME